MCHVILIGLPLLALSAFWFLPLPLAVPTFAVLIGATSLFYAYLIRVTRQPAMNGIEAMLNARGRVRGVHDGVVSVWVNSELWSARAAEGLHEGDRVKVIGVEGLRLHVRKILAGAPESARGCHG
jgi:membrane protein implicated in regulation of membrane protease activity